MTLFVNWAVKPFSMAVLGTFFAAVLAAGGQPSLDGLPVRTPVSLIALLATLVLHFGLQG